MPSLKSRLKEAKRGRELDEGLRHYAQKKLLTTKFRLVYGFVRLALKTEEKSNYLPGAPCTLAFLIHPL